MTAACESDFRTNQSHARADCTQNVGVSGRSKRQLKGVQRTQNDGAGSLKEGIGIKEFGRGADMLTATVEKEQNYADDHQRLNGCKLRDGTKILTEHVHREPGSRFLHKDLRKGQFRSDVEYIVDEDDFNQEIASTAPFPSKQADVNQQNQVQTGMNVHWESFLPQGHVKVLLVEDDDSTRHVVSALLRNCNYEVIAAANVVMAWELLDNPNNQFDLVLLDVVMPSLSGVSLLLKIMEHNSFKWIPVVMTSKHDSVDIVYQCLSKGAADFLVKPVRKNELKNIWQHVWRKRSRSANNGDGRAVKQTRNLVTPNSPVDSDNNMSGSNNVNDSENAASGLNINGGSDNGSGNQPVQVQRNHCPGPMAGNGDEDCQALSEDKSSSDQTLGCDLKMATPRPTPCDIDEMQQATDAHQKMDIDDPTFAVQGQGAAMVEKCNHQQECEPSITGPDGSAERRSEKAVDLIGGIECQPPPPTIVEQPGESADANEIMDQRGSNSPKEKEIAGSDFNSPPTLELTLKWPRNGSDKDADVDERRGLRQSGSSAFSRYSTKGLQQQKHPSGGTPTPRGHRMDGAYATQGLPSGGLGVNSSHPPQMGMPPDGTGSSKGSGEVCTLLETDIQNPHNGNGQDTSSSVVPQTVVHNGSKPTNKEAAVSHGMPRATSNPSPGHLHYEGIPAGYGPTMHRMYYVHPGPAWVAAPSPHLSDQGEVFDHPSMYQQHVAFGHLLHPQNNQQPYYHTHHRHNTRYHEHHNHTLNFQPPPLPSQQGEQPTAGSSHCGCSAVTVLDRTNGQSGSGGVHVNESPSRANNGSNGQNCHCNGAVAVATGDTAGNCGSGSGSGSGVDNSMNVKNGFDSFDSIMPACTPEDRFAWREAALNKFRQKRKERCFAKKVRYQSRKKLAEQRPRVRGQFVRQTAQDLTDETS